jgi:hypothetical protein
LEHRFQRSVDPEKDTTMPKNQINRERAVGKEHFGFSLKPMLDENRKGGLRVSDKHAAALQDADGSRGHTQDEQSEIQRSPHQTEQYSANVRGQPQMVQDSDTMPEGLQRERKGPLDKNVGRGEGPT